VGIEVGNDVENRHIPFSFIVSESMGGLTRAPQLFERSLPGVFAVGDVRASAEELVSSVPSRFILNAHKRQTPTQQLGMACFRSGRISALKVPSAQNPQGYCLDILLESLVVGERIAIRDNSGRLRAEGQRMDTEATFALLVLVLSVRLSRQIGSED
jgi:hypothetical protein